MYRSSKVEGWQDYPENLSYGGSKYARYNLKSYNRQLKDDSSRLFVPSSGEIAVKAIDTGSNAIEIVLNSGTALEHYLEKHDPGSNVRILLIPQQGSWGRLVIDEQSMRKILSALAVLPSFVDTLRNFGQQTGLEDSSSGGVFFRNDAQECLDESCYIVKQVELNGRRDCGDTWSIRQSGVYSRSREHSEQAFIIINPSACLQKRLKCIQENNEAPSSQALHAMILSCSMENWKWYINDLEQRYLKMKVKAQLTQIDEKGEPKGPTAEVCIEDTQKIQVLQDKFQQLAHVLDLNRTVLNGLIELFGASPSAETSVEVQTLRSLTKEADMSIRRVNRLLQRLDGTIALTRTILDFRCLASLQSSSHMMMELTKLAHEENNRMRELTEKATRDTDVVKWITFLTLVYLPASFVSSVMGMDYIKVNSRGRGFSLHFEGEFWVFFVLTAVLLITTMTLYVWYIRRLRKVTIRDLEKKYLHEKMS